MRTLSALVVPLGSIVSLLTLVAVGCSPRQYNQEKAGVANRNEKNAQKNAERLPADYQSWTAQKKLDFLWTQRILPSSYQPKHSPVKELHEVLTPEKYANGTFPNPSQKESLTPPEIDKDPSEWFPKIAGALPNVFFFRFNITMDTASDELPVRRPKSIHRSGAVAKVKFVPAANENGKKLTGLWQGANSGLVRLSYATTEDKAKNVTPGSGFKFLVNGQRSQNFVAMFSLDGTQNHNFFAETFSNIIPAPKNAILGLLGRFFARAAHFIGGVYLQDLSSVTENGQAVPEEKVVYPYRIWLEPTQEAQNLKIGENGEDFREGLTKVPTGSVLYKVFAVIPKNPSDEDGNSRWEEINSSDYRKGAVEVGQYETASEFVASEWADEKLFFQHQRFANKRGCILGTVPSGCK